MAQSFLKNLNWRFAIKKFDLSKKVPPDDLQKILDAVRYSPSSRGLQSYHVYVISNRQILSKLKPIANDQSQIDTCSYLLIFCARVDRQDMKKRIDDYMKISSQINKLTPDRLTTNKATFEKTIDKKSDAELAIWSAKQCYIAMGFALAACAELEIDSCPMEGFDKAALDKMLTLPPHLASTLLLPIGYRSEGPNFAKLRFSQEDLFTFIK